MKQISILALIIFSFSTHSTHAQTATITSAQVSNNNVVITYNITSAAQGQTFAVELWYSVNNGAYSQCRTVSAGSGDLAKMPAGTGLQLTWNVLADLARLEAHSVDFELRLTPNQTANSFTDSRDGKTYKTVKIGTQTWMAENLNYSTSSGSWCYENSTNNCTKYGRLYDWKTAKTVCPSGWHLPSDAEWSTLTNFVGSDESKKLKSTSGWNSSGNGIDAYGFTALPGGYRDDGGTFYYIGYGGYWWSSTEGSLTDAVNRDMGYSNSDVRRDYDGKGYGFSVRCVRDF